MRPTRALIDLAALRHNAAIARRLAPRSQLMAVVKANAYGHGAVAVAQALAQSVDAFAVAAIDEAAELREAGVSRPILLLEGLFSAPELERARQLQLWLMVHSEAQLRWLEQAPTGTALTTWLKVDTGMHRLGFAPENVTSAFYRLQSCTAVAWPPVLCTHFACADETDNELTSRQLECFNICTAALDAPRSAANSSALLAWPQTHLQWVRPGYMLYGNSPLQQPLAQTPELQPVMSLQSEVVALRELNIGDTVGYGARWRATRPSRIATVTAGYGDGYPRDAQDGTPVLIGGRRAPLAGRVSMDMLTVDVTDLPTAAIGDTATLWGPELPVEEIARHSGGFAYELLTRMPARVIRHYHQR